MWLQKHETSFHLKYVNYDDTGRIKYIPGDKIIYDDSHDAYASGMVGDVVRSSQPFLKEHR